MSILRVYIPEIDFLFSSMYCDRQYMMDVIGIH